MNINDLICHLKEGDQTEGQKNAVKNPGFRGKGIIYFTKRLDVVLLVVIDGPLGRPRAGTTHCRLIIIS